MRLVVDVELDGSRATITWPKRSVTLDDAGIAALMHDLAFVRARLGFAHQRIILRDDVEA